MTRTACCTALCVLLAACGASSDGEPGNRCIDAKCDTTVPADLDKLVPVALPNFATCKAGAGKVQCTLDYPADAVLPCEGRVTVQVSSSILKPWQTLSVEKPTAEWDTTNDRLPLRVVADGRCAFGPKNAFAAPFRMTGTLALAEVAPEGSKEGTAMATLAIPYKAWTIYLMSADPIALAADTVKYTHSHGGFGIYQEHVGLEAPVKRVIPVNDGAELWLSVPRNPWGDVKDVATKVEPGYWVIANNPQTPIARATRRSFGF